MNAILLFSVETDFYANISSKWPIPAVQRFGKRSLGSMVDCGGRSCCSGRFNSASCSLFMIKPRNHSASPQKHRVRPARETGAGSSRSGSASVLRPPSPSSAARLKEGPLRSTGGLRCMRADPCAFQPMSADIIALLLR